MKPRLKILAAFFAMLFVQLSFAQSVTVSGKVVDADNLPLPGVGIVIKGTTNGVNSDIDGKTKFCPGQEERYGKQRCRSILHHRSRASAT